MNQKALEVLLETARETQAAYWDALAALENALGCEIDGTQDLENVTIEELIHAD